MPWPKGIKRSPATIQKLRRPCTTGRFRRHGRVYKPNHHFADYAGYVQEHRLVVEEQWNCCLLPWADVHHRDEDIQNNVWYNLWPMMRAQHSSLEILDKDKV